jgi:hypothetical protein
MIGDLASGTLGIEQDEVGVGINRAKHAGVRLVEEFLPAVGVSFHATADVLLIRQSRHRGHCPRHGYRIRQAAAT